MHSAESEELSLYKVGDLVWMVKVCRHKDSVKNFNQSFFGLYIVKEVFPHHIYKLVQNGQISVQNEKKTDKVTHFKQLFGRTGTYSK